MSLLTTAGVTTYTYTTTTTSNGGGGIPAFLIIVYIAVVVLVVAGLWKTFHKANRPGWAAIIPIYNIYTIVKIANRPGWWVILYFIPLVNIITHLVVSLDVSKAFGKSDFFGVVGLWLFSFIGYLMLGFGDATYQAGGGNKPAAPAAAAPAA